MNEITHVTDPAQVAPLLDCYGALWVGNVRLTQPFVMQLSLMRECGWSVPIRTIVLAQDIAKGRLVEPFAPAALRGDFAPDCDFCQDAPATNDTSAGSYCDGCSARLDAINRVYDTYDDPDTDRDEADAGLKSLACAMPGWSGAVWILRTPEPVRIANRTPEPSEDDQSDYQDYCDRYRPDQIGAF